MNKKIYFLILFITIISCSAQAEEPVQFADVNLQAVVEETLGIADPTPTDMLRLTDLFALEKQISSLTGLGHAANLQALDCTRNQIRDISPLSELTNLQRLYLGRNQIGDISPLAGLTSLQILSLWDNRISNISVLSGLTNLQNLVLSDNQISDFSPLFELTNLQRLGLRQTRINDITFLSNLKSRLLELNLTNNQISDISLLSSFTSLETLYIGLNQISDISPLSELINLQLLGLDYNQISDLSPLHRLVNLQMLFLWENPLNTDAYTVYIPLFESYGTTVYYDQPIWHTLTISSTIGGSVVEPGEGDFNCTVNSIVDINAVAEPGYMFVNWTGSAVDADKVADPATAVTTVTMETDYTLHANFMQIRLGLYVDDDAPNDPGPNNSQSSDPYEDGTSDHPFDSIQKAIEAAENGHTVLIYPGIYSEQINFSGKALTVQGIATPSGIPVLENPNSIAVAFENDEGPDSVLKNFVIRNSFMAVFIDDCSPTISNLTIVDNQYDIGPYDTAQPVISNCIIWDNTHNNAFQLDARFSCIETIDYGEGNINLEPLFVDPDNGDYHLSSLAGRYSSQHNTWVMDDISSLCIDAGNPNVGTLLEPTPNGDRINIGAYGGTLYASMSGESDIERPVYFADANLKAAVEKQLGISDPTPTDMLRLTHLHALQKEIRDLTGLEYALNLKNAIFYNNQISDLSVLAELKNLTILRLELNSINDISALAGLTKLEVLYLHENQISDISPLAGLINLNELLLYNNQISDISALVGLTELTQLYLSRNQISDISALAGMTNLTSLKLEYNQISDISVLAELTNLEKLYLGDNHIGNISILANLTNLTELLLQGNQINEISVLTDLTNLTSLSLGRNQISDISVLAGLTNLIKLWLYNNQISDISVLASLTNLDQLNLGTNQISDISALSGMTNMKYLTLNNNQISDISALTGMMNLESLIMQNIPLNQEACDIHIPQILENNPDIRIYYYPCSNEQP